MKQFGAGIMWLASLSGGKQSDLLCASLLHVVIWRASEEFVSAPSVIDVAKGRNMIDFLGGLAGEIVEIDSASLGGGGGVGGRREEITSAEGGCSAEGFAGDGLDVCCCGLAMRFEMGTWGAWKVCRVVGWTGTSGLQGFVKLGLSVDIEWFWLDVKHDGLEGDNKGGKLTRGREGKEVVATVGIEELLLLSMFEFAWSAAWELSILKIKPIIN